MNIALDISEPKKVIRLLRMKNTKTGLIPDVYQEMLIGPEETLEEALQKVKKKYKLRTLGAVVLPDALSDEEKKMYEDLLTKKLGLMVLAFESKSRALVRAVTKTGDRAQKVILNFLASEKVELSLVEGMEVKQHVVVEKSELKDILLYWFTNKYDPENSTVRLKGILVGPFALASGLDKTLEKELPLSVEVANVWMNCFDLNNYVPEMNKKMSLRYAALIGALLGAR